MTISIIAGIQTVTYKHIFPFGLVGGLILLHIVQYQEAMEESSVGPGVEHIGRELLIDRTQELQ